MTHYQHLGPYSDWVDTVRGQQPLWPLAVPGPDTQWRIREALSFSPGTEAPLEVRFEGTWERDGVCGEALSWAVGYGPRTEAWLLKPAGVSNPLPGVVALHDHSDFKYHGKEKIADGSDGPLTAVQALRERAYGGQAYANALARAGFAVLVHDAFLWGSRRFPLDAMPVELLHATDVLARAEPPAGGLPQAIHRYNTASALHEHTVAKYCDVLGTTLAGVVCYEDRVAVNYLRSRSDVLSDRLGCIGLSGGGNRAALLLATHEAITAAVIVGLMSTYAGLLDHNMSHTWMLFPAGWARSGDWPDVAACRAPLPLLVQYNRDDHLFTPDGMEAAHQRLQMHYAGVGQSQAYTGEFYPGPHKFDLDMQQHAFAWLKRELQANGAPA